MKKCKICGERFKPIQSFVSWCSPECGLKLAQERLKSPRTGKRKTKLRDTDKPKESRGTLLKRAQIAFNSYIKARDRNFACISCGAAIKGSGHASHYLSVGARPNLRFNEDNVHRSCVRCNVFLHGNLINYRIRLVKMIGLERVEALENDTTPKKYSMDDIKVIIGIYRSKTKELNRKSSIDATNQVSEY